MQDHDVRTEAAASALSERARELFAAEQARRIDRTPRSHALYQRAVRSMPLGVASSFQVGTPYPIYLERGEGSRVWDVDGHEYVDFHNGFGSMIVGHAHPRVVEAIERAARRGTHFAVTVEDTVTFAELLCQRFGLDQVRFTNSGTESTMDAVRLARAATGRAGLCKIDGSYHGHHDSAMFSGLGAPLSSDGHGVPMSAGVPAVLRDLTWVVPFNDAAAVDRLFAERAEEIACLLIEPVMQNIGIVLPRPGYLEALRRACDRHGVVLIYDEVKCGATIAAGGATERFGVQPDLVCLAKAIAGGLPAGAFGGRADLMDVITNGDSQQGTYNGNPLVAAAGVVVMRDILTPDAYDRLARLGTRLASGCQRVIDDHGLPGHTVDLGAKGCVSWRPDPLGDYRDFLDTDDELFSASWAWLVNHGIFMTPGNEEQWMISVQHDEGDIDRYVEAFAAFGAAITR
ncbi:MAG: aspartate aminotransferase family protein [Actinobacteria bacterium]|nr:aspartate aminotransferase family protein [Actinomycetota bacterium]